MNSEQRHTTETQRTQRLHREIFDDFVCKALRSGQSLEQQVFVLERKFHEGMAAVNVQFLADVIAMSVDCARTDEEFLCDLLAGFVFSKQREYAKFGRGETFQT